MSHKDHSQIRKENLEQNEKMVKLKEELKEATKFRYLHCDICEAKFMKKELYDVHITTHNIEEHKCDNCKLFFAKKHFLNFHVASIHEGKKPNQCDSCVISFKTEQMLKVTRSQKRPLI